MSSLYEDAPDAYRHFDRRDTGWTKVMLKPEAAGAKAGKGRHQKGGVRADVSAA